MLNELGEIVEVDAMFLTQKTASISKALEGKKGSIGDDRYKIERLKLGRQEAVLYLVNETKLMR